MLRSVYPRRNRIHAQPGAYRARVRVRCRLRAGSEPRRAGERRRGGMVDGRHCPILHVLLSYVRRRRRRQIDAQQLCDEHVSLPLLPPLTLLQPIRLIPHNNRVPPLPLLLPPRALKKNPPPPPHILLPPRSGRRVVYEHHSVRPAEERSREGGEAFLPCRVPDLQCHRHRRMGGRGNENSLAHKVGADRSAVGGGKVLGRVLHVHSIHVK